MIKKIDRSKLAKKAYEIMQTVDGVEPTWLECYDLARVELGYPPRKTGKKKTAEKKALPPPAVAPKQKAEKKKTAAPAQEHLKEIGFSTGLWQWLTKSGDFGAKIEPKKDMSIILRNGSLYKAIGKKASPISKADIKELQEGRWEKIGEQETFLSGTKITFVDVEKCLSFGSLDMIGGQLVLTIKASRIKVKYGNQWKKYDGVRIVLDKNYTEKEIFQALSEYSGNKSFTF